MKNAWVHVLGRGEPFWPRPGAADGFWPFVPETADCSLLATARAGKAPRRHVNTDHTRCGTSEWISELPATSARSVRNGHRQKHFDTHCSPDQELMTQRGVLG